MLKNSPGCCRRSAAFEAREPQWGADTLWPQELSSKGNGCTLRAWIPPGGLRLPPPGAPQVERQLSPGSVGVGFFMLLLLNVLLHFWTPPGWWTRLRLWCSVVQFDKCKFNSLLFMFVNNASVYCGLLWGIIIWIWLSKTQKHNDISEGLKYYITLQMCLFFKKGLSSCK